MINGRGSSRQICLYNASQDLPIAKVTLDMSPAALIPHYDDDTKFLLFAVHEADVRILFLWSKGSRQIHAYHITSSPPALNLLPSFDSSDLQNAVSFLPKPLVNVEKVEIIQGLRLAGGNKIERFGFSIPRNRVPQHLFSIRNLIMLDRILSRRYFCTDFKYPNLHS